MAKKHFSRSARAFFFKCKRTTERVLKSKSCQHKPALILNFLSNSNCAGLFFDFWFFTEPYCPTKNVSWTQTFWYWPETYKPFCCVLSLPDSRMRLEAIFSFLSWADLEYIVEKEAIYIYLHELRPVLVIFALSSCPYVSDSAKYIYAWRNSSCGDITIIHFGDTPPHPSLNLTFYTGIYLSFREGTC